VHVFLWAVTEVFNVTGPPIAQPLFPLPPAPVFAPGIPDVVADELISNQPFNVDVLSIVDPGNATHIPAIVPVNCISNFDTEVLTNLNV
jgi:hypothetical protein